MREKEFYLFSSKWCHLYSIGCHPLPNKEVLFGAINTFNIARFTSFLLVRISFDQNGFHAIPYHLVGHFYVIFENHVSPPVYLLFRYLGAIWLDFRVHIRCLFWSRMRLFFLNIGAIGGVYGRIDNDQWCLYVWCSRIDNHQ
jgi:hypothetical protein